MYYRGVEVVIDVAMCMFRAERDFIYISLNSNKNQLLGKEKWKAIKECDYYDYDLIECRTKLLQGLAALGDNQAIVMALREGLLRKIGNIGDTALYSHTNTGTKYQIEEYLNEVVKQLEFVSNCQRRDLFEGDTLQKQSSHVPLSQLKFDFFFEVSQAFGRTALLLSGGASLGCYHFGVVKALYEQNLLPKIISGSSVGSIVAALVATLKDEELPKIFTSGYLNYDVFTKRGEKGAWKRKLLRLITKGVLMDINLLKEAIRGTIGDITFREAYYRTGRVLNITIASTSK